MHSVSPHFDLGPESRLYIVETTVLIRKAGVAVELDEDELLNLCVTAGPAAIEAIRVMRQARGADPKFGAGASEAPGVEG